MRTILTIGFLALCCAGCASTREAQSNDKLLPPLSPYVTEVANELASVPAERRVVLGEIATSITTPP